MKGSERDAVLMRMAFVGRQPVAKTGMLNGLRRCSQLFKFDQIVTSARATMPDVVINDRVEEHAV